MSLGVSAADVEVSKEEAPPGEYKAFGRFGQAVACGSAAKKQKRLQFVKAALAVSIVLHERRGLPDLSSTLLEAS